jgi:hypothetical protein
MAYPAVLLAKTFGVDQRTRVIGDRLCTETHPREPGQGCWGQTLGSADYTENPARGKW